MVSGQPRCGFRTGIYVGAGGGYNSFVLNNVNVPDRVNPELPFQDTGGKGWLGTAILGYDYQITPSFVVGVFGDYDWTNAKGEWRDRRIGENISGTLKQDSAWAVGGRIGYLANPGTLLYVSGGYTG